MNTIDLMYLDKEDFEFSAEWRRSLVARYPADVRNAEAARLLDALATEGFSDFDGGEIHQRISKHFSHEPDETSEELREAIKQVGFSIYPQSVREFYQTVLDRLDARHDRRTAA